LEKVTARIVLGVLLMLTGAIIITSR